MACECFNRLEMEGYEVVCTCEKPLTTAEWAEEVKRLTYALETWREDNDRMTALLHAARLCDQCGQPATWEICGPSGPWEAKCEAHSAPIRRLRGRRELAKTGPEMETDTGGTQRDS